MSKDFGINLVLGSGTDYSQEQILPFVRSLRSTGFSGEIALLVYKDQIPALVGLATSFSVTLVPILRHPVWMPRSVGSRLQNRRRMRSLHRVLSKVLPGICPVGNTLDWLGKHLHYMYHIACSRYLLYYWFLRGHRDACRHVLLSDVRDVVFQDDPFRYSLPDSLFCYMDPTVHLGDEPVNVDWMTTTYGDSYCRQQTGRRISCSGTTLGDYSSMITYLYEMNMELIRVLPKVVGLHGVDQAVHNYLLWEGRFPNVVTCENGRHAVMTLKNAAIAPETLDEQGNLFNMDGTLAPVLHQYDFHPMLKAKWNYQTS